MATRKKVTVETVETDAALQTPSDVVEQGVANTAEQTGFGKDGKADGQPVEDIVREKKNAGKALEIAKNYSVKRVWGTADGVYWATTLEKKQKLPKNRGDIIEYNFE